MLDELTDDVRACDPLYGRVEVRELTDAEVETVHSDFLDDNGLDLLSELKDVTNQQQACAFAQRWQEKLEDAEGKKLDRK
jgi:hypothetical protein